ncbi:H-type small acid-soluble spore protein [Paenibacillus abyssi]|uniref:Spore protein n=1 Tax=Paenibacillus abyssi TaxID=1340531 RepID=A0A917G436_9BACL|nr:H-type small acid-soluble spore protein [Paenibacillus abyssi]GGG21466.1 hypothetical protein GCM10010916_42740 [Paenibacillus abyssi]
MDAMRAQQIVQSEDTIPVHLEGQSVWIEKVDTTNGMAAVHLEDNPNHKQTVPVDRLQEG